MNLNHKIDFLGLISVSFANPNGDPLDCNRPRTDSEGLGIISDVCIKRKLRDRLAESGEQILISPPSDRFDSINERLKQLHLSRNEDISEKACDKWYDVRAFGHVFFGAGRKNSKSESVRGAVSIQHAISVHPVELIELPITRCINSTDTRNKHCDTLGFKYLVRYGLYMLKGSVCVHAANKTGFSDEDADKLISALKGLFDNDCSASRPEGSMVMERLYIWRHENTLGKYPSAKVFDTIKPVLNEGCTDPRSFSDYTVEEQHLNGLMPEIIR